MCTSIIHMVLSRMFGKNERERKEMCEHIYYNFLLMLYTRTCIMHETILSEGRALPHNHRQKSFPNGTLIIEDLQKTRDDGLYDCVAENNRSRTARRDVSINIMGMNDYISFLLSFI